MGNNTDDMVHGDWSVPDNVVSNKTKFIAVAIIVIVVAVSIITVVKIGTNSKDDMATEGNIDYISDMTSPAPVTKKTTSEADKIEVLKSLSAAATKTSTGATKTVSSSVNTDNAESAEIISEKKRILESFSTPSSGPTLSVDEKLKILESSSN